MPTSRRGPDPVFVDRTGRRRRLFAVAGATGGLVLVLAAAALLAGFTGDGPATVPGWPTGGRPARSTTARPAAPGPDTTQARPSAEPTLPVPVAAPAPRATTAITATAAPTGTATRTPGSRRRSPSHTPAPHPTKTH